MDLDALCAPLIGAKPDLNRWWRVYQQIKQLDPADQPAAIARVEPLIADWPAWARNVGIPDIHGWLARPDTPSWSMVRRLSLDRLGGVKGARALAASPRLATIHELELTDSRLSTRALSTLLSSPHFRDLRRITFRLKPGRVPVVTAGLAGARWCSPATGFRLDYGPDYKRYLTADD